MPFAPIFALAILIVGLLALPIMASVPRLRPGVRFVVPVAVGLCTTSVFASFLEPVDLIVLSRLRPSTFFGTILAIEASRPMWPLVAATCCAALGAALVQLSRRAQPSLLLGVVTLGILVTVVGGLWAGNLLTMLVFWGAFDLAWTLGMVVSGASAQRVALGSGVSMMATMSLWAGAALVTAGGGGLSWHLLTLTDLGRDLLLLAGVLRLGLYPFQMALPTNLSKSIPAATALFFGPMLGWSLLLRLTTVGEGLVPAGTWFSTLGVVTLAAGGVLAWTRRRTGEIVSWASLATIGATLWGASLAGDQAGLVLAGGGATWILGVTLTYLDRGVSRQALWWTGASAWGGLALLCAPLTPGVAVTSVLLRKVAERSLTGWQMVAIICGFGLLAAALVRRLLIPGARENPRPLEITARAAGVLTASIPLLAAGILPALLLQDSPASLVGLVAQAGVLGWGLWLLALASGAFLVWAEPRFRHRIEPFLGLLHDFVSLDWAWRLFLGGLGRAVQLFQNVAELLEGAGAVLWSLVIFVLLLLILMGST